MWHKVENKVAIIDSFADLVSASLLDSLPDKLRVSRPKFYDHFPIELHYDEKYVTFSVLFDKPIITTKLKLDFDKLLKATQAHIQNYYHLKFSISSGHPVLYDSLKLDVTDEVLARMKGEVIRGDRLHALTNRPLYALAKLEAYYLTEDSQNDNLSKFNTDDIRGIAKHLNIPTTWTCEKLNYSGKTVYQWAFFEYYGAYVLFKNGKPFYPAANELEPYKPSRILPAPSEKQVIDLLPKELKIDGYTHYLVNQMFGIQAYSYYSQDSGKTMHKRYYVQKQDSTAESSAQLYIKLRDDGLHSDLGRKPTFSGISGKSSEGITVLSLFDGMSCGQLALKKLGIKVKQYFASEIDKYAIQVTQQNFPNTIQLGDVRNISAKDLPKIDLLIGGSPCQGFSMAGNQLAFDDPRSKLFFEFVRLKNELKPTYFLLENVRMKKEYEAIITKYMGVEPIEINSALVSAQNRKRLYWTNISNGSYTIPQPKDKGILLKDIIQKNAPEKYFLSDKMLNYFNKRAANFNDGKVNVRSKYDKATTLTASMASSDISDNFIVAKRGRESAVLTTKRTDFGKQIRKEYEAGNVKISRKYIQRYEPRTDGKTNCLTSVQKDNLVIVDFSHKNEGLRYYEGKSPCMQARDYKEPRCISYGKTIRRLTPVECERLQTVPDNYTACVSDTQRYKMLGNGWTVDVIAHIFSFIDFKKITGQAI